MLATGRLHALFLRSEHHSRRFHLKVISTRRRHPWMVQRSMTQNLSSILVGLPSFVTKSNKSMMMIAELRLTRVSRFPRRNTGNSEAANVHVIHSMCPRPALLICPVTVDVQLCFSFSSVQTIGRHDAKAPALICGSIAPIIETLHVVPGPNVWFEEQLLWAAQRRPEPRSGLAYLSDRGSRHALLSKSGRVSPTSHSSIR